MPRFLSVDEVKRIHLDQVTRYGGAREVRDELLLNSAVAMPQAGFGDEYYHRDLAEMAAAYIFHIEQNHPFVDGNKRAGAVAGLVFLELNDVVMRLTNDELEAMVLSVAKGEMNKGQVAEFLGLRIA